MVWPHSPAPSPCCNRSPGPFQEQIWRKQLQRVQRALCRFERLLWRVWRAKCKITNNESHAKLGVQQHCMSLALVSSNWLWTAVNLALAQRVLGPHLPASSNRTGLSRKLLARWRVVRSFLAVRLNWPHKETRWHYSWWPCGFLPYIWGRLVWLDIEPAIRNQWPQKRPKYDLSCWTVLGSNLQPLNEDIALLTHRPASTLFPAGSLRRDKVVGNCQSKDNVFKGPNALLHTGFSMAFQRASVFFESKAAKTEDKMHYHCSRFLCHLSQWTIVCKNCL